MDQRTPRRLGMRRSITPKMKQTPPQMKRTIEDSNAIQTTSTADENIENILVTPIKKRKTSLGRFSFTPKEQTNDPNQKDDETDFVNQKTDDELKVEIQQMNEHLEKYEKYKSEKKELEHLIGTWKAGGVQALRQLQTEIQPEQEIEQILEHFKLPVDIFGNFTE